MKLKPKELKYISLCALGVMIFTCLPYLFAWLIITPENMQYMGYVYNPDEPNVYLSWMFQASRGRFLFFDQFTTEPQKGIFFNLFFFVLGKLSGLTHIPLVWVYHIARFLCGFGLLLMVYIFVSFFTEDRQVRHLSFFLACFSSGFGWLIQFLNLSGINPVDYSPHLVMPEAFIFLSIYLNPLFSFSIILLLLTFLLFALATQRKSLKCAAFAGFLALLLGNVHSYDLLIIYSVALVYLLTLLLLQRKSRQGRLISLLSYFLIVLFSLPAALYQYYVFQTEPVFRQKALTFTQSPRLLEYFLSYGLVFFLAIFGFFQGLKDLKNNSIFLSWAVIGFAILYLPLSFQRKLSEGLHLPLCFLAALGLLSLLNRWHITEKVQKFVILSFVILTVPSNIFFIRDNFLDLLENQRKIRKGQIQEPILMPPFYLHKEEIKAMKWLKENSQPTEAVLSSPFTGSYIPTISGNRVFIGHWAETLNFKDKLRQLGLFFQGNRNKGLDAFRIRLLQENRIKYLYFGPYEKQLSDFKPEKCPYLSSRYRNSQVSIYQFFRPKR